MPRIERFDFEVEGTPDEVAQRLRARTRTQLMPSQGRMIKLGDAPLAGLVRGDRFTLALNQPDVLGRLRAVATGQFMEAPGGTRVVGQSGVPTFWTWYVRLASVFGAAIVVGGAFGYATLTDLRLLGVVTMLAGVAFLGMTGAIGLHLRHAGEQVTNLADAIRRNLAGGAWPMMPSDGEGTDTGRATGSQTAAVERVDRAS